MNRIESCYVISSSGCHRYPYWNEQYLFDERLDTGWSTPSRKALRLEFLEVSLGSEYRVCRLRMRPRSIHSGAGFPTGFRLLVVGGAEAEKVVLTVEQLAPQAGVWIEWEFPPVSAASMRIEFHKVNFRPEGKYFLQIMGLELWAA